MRRRLTLLAASILPLLGCASVRTFDEIRKTVPEDRFLKIGDQLVHIEQAGQGEPLILLHGFGASTYAWRNVMPALAAAFRVVAIDLNGFGYTQRPRAFESYTREGQAALVLRVMDALGLDSAHLMGHSYGGGLSLFIASRYPQRVRSLVLVDSSAPTYANDRRSRAASVKPLVGLYLRSFVLRPNTVRRALRHSFHDDSLVTPELVHEYYERIRVEGVVDAYHGLTAPTRTVSEPVVLEEIRMPALVVWGAEDELISAESGRRAAARMPSAEFVLMEGVGHAPMEEKPEELLRIVLPFLERQRG
ncbi:MAG TPA: alpha/beta fold hydrolase [Thermoanaerobaculia bacterium]|nr:alpha/beta fold hydrolase [Thermoanaerobaculia bacterium]